MIEVINLTKRYGDKKAVDNISFKAEDGEVLGFLGPCLLYTSDAADE